MSDRRKRLIKKPKAVSDNERIRELEKEVARLEPENDLLKKWQQFEAEENRRSSSSSRGSKKSSQ